MDGFSETYWNAIQLLGWVYLGDWEFVRRASDSVSDHGTFWQEQTLPDGRHGLFETSANPPELISLSSTAAWNGGAVYPSYTDARDVVLSALQENRLRAWGLENGEGDLKEIPAVQWAKLDFYQGKSYRIYAAPDDHFRPGATKWYGLIFKRVEVLEIWPDPLENLPQVKTTQPLAPLSDGTLAAFLKRDTWTLTEALFLLHGNEPPGFETSDELTSHFHDINNLAVNSIQSGKLCREICVAGERRFIESPARWFDWALEKDLPVAEAVRTKMCPAESVDEKTDTPAQGTPGLASQSSRNRRKGGHQPGPYYTKLKKIMALLYEKDLEKFENGTPAEIRRLVKWRFKNDGVSSYPKSRSGLNRAIEKAKREAIDSADRL